MINISKEEAAYILVDVNLTEANLSHSDQFKSELIALLNDKQRSIWLNMQHVSYVDSSFLGAMVAGLKHAIGMKRDVVLINLQKDIDDMLKLIRLDKVFKIYSTEEEAQQAIA
ncbi:STAS domain-containing protein [Mucilaginibacter galii]|uniref:Anti-sigma factor antagonist n=1 Tax=Mucilaginibacter galii TaxID=2005073 RepID=A0A917J954_9SPHI|nr:STAS domain-containing protein [Mucilaginibacter galii]GGI49736.1 putative anti-sigma factor antagonist [Mucilaginibacter galii]